VTILLYIQEKSGDKKEAVNDNFTKNSQNIILFPTSIKIRSKQR